MAEAKTLIVVDPREPIWLSAVRDAISFGALIGTALVLNLAMPPSGWLNFALGFAWIAWMVGKGAKRRALMTPEEARAWLDREYPEQAS